MNFRQPSKKELYIEKTVPLETMHRRLDQYLTETNIGFTRSKIQRLIRNGDVSVNSITIKKSGHHIIPDDIISICIPESRPELGPLGRRRPSRRGQHGHAGEAARCGRNG